MHEGSSFSTLLHCSLLATLSILLYQVIEQDDVLKTTPNRSVRKGLVHSGKRA